MVIRLAPESGLYRLSPALLIDCLLHPIHCHTRNEVQEEWAQQQGKELEALQAELERLRPEAAELAQRLAQAQEEVAETRDRCFALQVGSRVLGCVHTAGCSTVWVGFPLRQDSVLGRTKKYLLPSVYLTRP